jgi:CBS domain containing-hemolysin-like protein
LATKARSYPFQEKKARERQGGEAEEVIPTDITLLGITALLLGVLCLAIIEVSFHYFNKISIRTYREEPWKMEFLSRCFDEPMSFLLPLRIGIQGALIGVTVLVTNLYIASGVSRALVLAFLTMLPVILIFREALPNIIGRNNPEKILLAMLPAFRVYMRVVMPISRPLVKLVRIFLGAERQEEEGILEGDEGRMVQSIVDFGDKIVREVMTPRPEMVAVRRDATVGELGALFIEEKNSRLPVYEEDLDHVIGLVFAIDFLAYREEATPDSPIEPLIRKVRFVPETKKVAELLPEFQRSQSTLAMVVDEYGGTSGLVSVEDLLEEIVGDIHDEFDEVDQEIVKEGEGVYLVSGKADIDDVKDQLRLEVNGKGFETVSGYLLESLGRVPQAGETIDLDGMKVEVVEAEGQRIHKVRFQLP